ncbi:MAG: SMC-Scp complex subunit ScpB [Candidatus Thermoplasmatota archaeon]
MPRTEPSMVLMAAEFGAPTPEFDPVLVVEAALFSAGKPLATEEIAENTGLDRRKVLGYLKELQARYANANTALEIGKAGDKWGMQVCTAYAEKTTKLAPMEIPLKLLKTLALIAYHQPVLQSDVKEMVGDKVYEHVALLVELGLVKKRVHERSFLLVTSERFPEYFGIPAADREGIKTWLAEKVGLQLPKTDDKGNAKLNTFDDNVL